MGPLEALLILAVLATPVALLIWVFHRIRFAMRSRPCPRCGKPVRRGNLDCPHCSFDFRTIGTTSPG